MSDQFRKHILDVLSGDGLIYRIRGLSRISRIREGLRSCDESARAFEGLGNSR